MDSMQTIGQIADALDVKNHVVAFAIRKLGVKPVCRAQHYRLYDKDAVALVRAELAARAKRQAVQHDS